MTLTVLVTGATSGFGAAIARRFARDGHRVIAAGRRTDRLTALRNELGENVHPLTLDVTDTKAVAALPGGLPEAWRGIDVLVNNAGLALGVNLAPNILIEDWDLMVATNIVGLMHVTHAILPHMVERDRGHIVNVGSPAGSYPYPGGNVYGASKAFVLQFTLGLKADLAGTGVRVTNIEPGLASGTEFSQVRLHGDTQRASKVYEGTEPLTADDVAEAVSWAVSLPPHVNINRIEMMPTCQGPGPFQIKRHTS